MYLIKKITFLLSLCIGITVKCLAGDHVTMSIQNATADSSWLEYDVFIVNDGTTTLKLRGYQFGINFSLSILNGGVPASSSYTYIAGTRDASLSILTNNNPQYNNFQLKNTSTNISVVNAVNLPTGVPLRLGRFRFTNTVNWTAGSVPNLQFQLASATGKLRSAAIVYTSPGDSTRNLIFVDASLNGVSNVTSLALNVALPVNVSSFSGSQSAHNDVLEWTTSSEENNSHFNLQHSTDGIEFNTIGKIYSMAEGGNSFAENRYTFAYDQPQSGHNYYRLEQVDIDGHSTLESKTLDLFRQVKGQKVGLYPNPASHVLFVDFISEKVQNSQIIVRDLQGRMLESMTFVSSVGSNKIPLHTGDLPQGIYLIQLLENNKLLFADQIRKVD